MEIQTYKLKEMLAKCRKILNKGYTSARNSGIDWLNHFCAEFLEFANSLHQYIAAELTGNAEGNEHVETMFLCLAQIVNCIKHMERTIKAEKVVGMAISASRQHFLDRIHWCLERLRAALKGIAAHAQQKQLEEHNFVELMDVVLDLLAPYACYNEEQKKIVKNVAEENAEAMFASKKVRSIVDLILGQTLAFANVALKQDKKALSALCQKVLRECMSLQEECALSQENGQLNECNRKLKAISLENALYQLEDYINEALLRLVYTCFLDFNRLSIEKLRAVMRTCDTDDAALDDFVADFDVNIDRTTQIGIFAIAFAPSMKIKTSVRSCLASLESLDACLIPTLQATHSADIYAEILEQHFNEEVAKFKNVIQEIIDSSALTGCYLDMLAQGIGEMEKCFEPKQLCELAQMAEFVHAHFQLPVNQKQLHKLEERAQLYEKFTLILRECQAILMCVQQVEPQRVLKRFKIMRSVLRKFHESLGNANPTKQQPQDVFVMSDEISESQRMFETLGISPSIRSILYCNQTSMNRRSRCAASDSLKGNYSKMLPNTPETSPVGNNLCSNALKNQRQCSVRRKQSLRTAMFKRQKTTETEQIYSAYKNMSVSMQISEILDQLTDLSSNFTQDKFVQSKVLSAAIESENDVTILK